jgi:hypothetical protein
MRVFAFDVDETLEVSGGPVKLRALLRLREGGDIVGICGNWPVLVQALPVWHQLVSFIGPVRLRKDEFLAEIADHIPAEEHIMVGNIAGVSGASDDQGAAERAGWRFISEREFSQGKR